MLLLFSFLDRRQWKCYLKHQRQIMVFHAFAMVHFNLWFKLSILLERVSDKVHFALAHPLWDPYWWLYKVLGISKMLCHSFIHSCCFFHIIILLFCGDLCRRFTFTSAFRYTRRWFIIIVMRSLLHFNVPLQLSSCPESFNIPYENLLCQTTWLA